MLQFPELPTQSLTTLSKGSGIVVALMPIVFHSDTSVLTWSRRTGTPLPYSSVTSSLSPFAMPAPQSDDPVPGFSHSSIPPVFTQPWVFSNVSAFAGSYGYGLVFDGFLDMALGVTGGSGLY